MKRPSKPNFEEERAVKEEAARLLRGLQRGEYCTEHDIIKHSHEIQRILVRYFAARNNNSSINNYSIRDSVSCQYDSNNEDDYDPILDDEDEEFSKESVWACPICPEDCWKCPGYLVNHFIEDKINCLCQCHHNYEEKSRTKHRPSAAVISSPPADATINFNDNGNDHNTDVIRDLVRRKCLVDDCSQCMMGFVIMLIGHHMSADTHVVAGGRQVGN